MARVTGVRVRRSSPCRFFLPAAWIFLLPVSSRGSFQIGGVEQFEQTRMDKGFTCFENLKYRH
jgi:hypothetical protein